MSIATGGIELAYQDRNNRPNYNQGYQKPAPIAPATFATETYVDVAEKVMQEKYGTITTTKLRIILAMVSDIYNAENIRTEETLLPESLEKLSLMRVRLAYECGRDRQVKLFVETARLLDYLKTIGKNRATFILYARYLEALVAYHRFFGGRT